MSQDNNYSQVVEGFSCLPVFWREFWGVVGSPQYHHSQTVFQYGRASIVVFITNIYIYVNFFIVFVFLI